MPVLFLTWQRTARPVLCAATHTRPTSGCSCSRGYGRQVRDSDSLRRNLRITAQTNEQDEPFQSLSRCSGERKTDDPEKDAHWGGGEVRSLYTHTRSPGATRKRKGERNCLAVLARLARGTPDVPVTCSARRSAVPLRVAG